MKYSAVLFDLDGTLLDTAPDFVTATQRLAAELQHPDPSAELVRTGVTYGSQGIIERVFNLEPDSPNFEQLRQRLIAFYSECLTDQTAPFPGISELLRELQQQQIPWGIVTNKPARSTQAILAQLPLVSAPATVICPDHVNNTKPHPEPVLAACRELSLEPQTTVFIGDHLRDIQSGQAAGTATIAAAYGYIKSDDNPDLWGANHVVAHAGDIINHLT